MTVSAFPPGLTAASALDAHDALAPFRRRFHLPPDRVYLDGNSLGLLSRDAEATIGRALEDWKQRAIGGWLEAQPPWFTLAEALAARVAPFIGAQPAEVAVANSTTVNLHQLLGTLRPERPRILAFGGEFPSDLHAIRAYLRGRGADPQTDLVLVPPGADGLIDEGEIAARLGGGIGLAVLPSVVYTTGQLLDLAWLTAAAHAGGALIGFDLSHSIGVVPHALSAIGADFAVWCHYKYLNAGPGAIGGLYLNARHSGRAPGLAGWWGTRKEQMFDPDRVAGFADGAAALQVGTPDVLSLAALDGALRVAEEAGIAPIRAKSLVMTRYLMDAIAAALPGVFGFANPREDARRGGHVALRHPEARRICRALGEAGVVADHRPPDLVRLAPAPLYNSFADCRRAVEALHGIVSGGKHLLLADQPSLVP